MKNDRPGYANKVDQYFRSHQTKGISTPRSYARKVSDQLYIPNGYGNQSTTYLMNKQKPQNSNDLTASTTKLRPKDIKRHYSMRKK